MRDLNSLQNQNQTLSEKLWQSGVTAQQSNLKVNQLNVNIMQAEAALQQTRGEIGQLYLNLENEKTQQAVIKECLDCEILKHAETGGFLHHARDMNRCFVTLLDKIKFSGAAGTTGYLQLEDLQIGSLMKENLGLKRDLIETGTRLEKKERILVSKDEAIGDLEKKNGIMLKTLALKEREILAFKEELYQFCTDDECELDKVPLGKRKRGNDEGNQGCS